MIRRWAVIAAFFLFTSCSVRPFEEKVAAPGPMNVSPSPAASGLPPRAPSSVHAASGKPLAPRGKEPSTSVTGTTNPNDTLPVTVELSPACGTKGSAMTATIRTEPHSGLSMAVGYSDNQAHGTYGFGDTNDQGIFVWNWVISPEAPYGEAGLLVAASTADGKRGGSSNVEFVVARRC